jgi:serine/threonine-protein kinase HipA
MKRCHKCLLPLTSENTGQWHTRCIRSFFNSDELPLIALDERTLLALATESTEYGVTTAGVQPKLSLHLDPQKSPRLTVVNHPSGYILKPQSPDYPNLPQLESTAMHLAQAAKIRTVDHALIQIESGELAYITKRIDRRITKKSYSKIAMEDFCQLSGRLTEDKYKGSYEQCGAILRQHSSQALLDVTNLFYLLVFSFVIGNNDMHLKNFSLYTPEKNRTILTPAYDLLPITLIFPNAQEETALILNNRKNNIGRSDFIALAKNLGLHPNVANRLIDRLLSLYPVFEETITNSFLGDDQQRELKELITQRMKRLQ